MAGPCWRRSCSRSIRSESSTAGVRESSLGVPRLEFRLQAGSRVLRRSRLLFRSLGTSRVTRTILTRVNAELRTRGFESLRWEFPVRSSLFGVPCSEFPVRNSLFGIPCSEFPVRNSLFGIPCLEFRLQAGSTVFRRSRLLSCRFGISKAARTILTRVNAELRTRNSERGPPNAGRLPPGRHRAGSSQPAP